MLAAVPWLLLPFILTGVIAAVWGVRRWRSLR